MHIVSIGDNLHEIPKPVFWKKKEKNIINLSSAQFARGVEMVHLNKRTLYKRHVSVSPFEGNKWVASSTGKAGFEHAQNIHIHIILRMRKVSHWPLLFIHTFYSIHHENMPIQI